VLESRINDIVKRKLSRNIAILDRVEVTDASTRPWEHSSVRTRTLVYKNRYFGRLSEEVQAADQCTIMRGSSESGGVLVEANRGYNPDHAYEDFELLKVKPNIQTCVSKTTSLPLTQSFWG
jgi:hypothetical protein